MVFSSLFFIFFFLPVSLIAYYLVDDKYKNVVLLISSLFFYAWGGPRYLLLLVGESYVSYFCARRIAEVKSHKKFWLVLDIVILLGLLIIFKYTNFICANMNALFGVPAEIPNIVLPIGISFYTFQLISYVVDVYRGDVMAKREFWKVLLYSSLFHQCIAGPIVRFETVAGEIDNRTISRGDIFYGMRRFAIGLAKKAILANTCASVADALLPVGSGAEALSGLPFSAYWIGMIFYTLEIYLDFSAYSDMAIGMGRMVGFHYLENFNYPYIAASVKDFWRRWHISLSTFFRDYVYIPLGGSRVSSGRYVFNLLVVWFLTGMWHGASWNYIIWGLYFFVFLLIEKFAFGDKLPKAIGHITAPLIIIFGWVIFRFTSSAELFTTLKGMFGIGASGFNSLQITTILKEKLFFTIFAFIAVTPLGKYLHKALILLTSKNAVLCRVFRFFEAIIPFVLVLLAALSLIGDSYNPFLYFQF